MSPIATLPAAVIETVARALVHFLWQGALVAAVAAVALAVLGESRARARYAVACAALLTMAILPTITVATLWPATTSSLGPGTALADTHDVAGAAPLQAAALQGANAAAARATPATLERLAHRLEPVLPWLFGLWLLGVGLLAARHLNGWRRVRRLRLEGASPAAGEWQASADRLARRLGIGRAVELLASTRVQVPITFGFLKPVVLVPLGAFHGLAPQQLEAIVIHELAHIRRHDYLVNLLQLAVETLLFYHPAVWWTSRQLRLAREHCCDDLAVSTCGDRWAYAGALVDMEGLRGTTPALAMGADGGSLLGRIRRLSGASAAAGPRWLAATLCAVTLAGGGALALTVTSAKADAAPPATPFEADVFALGGEPRLPGAVPQMQLALLDPDSDLETGSSESDDSERRDRDREDGAEADSDAGRDLTAERRSRQNRSTTRPTVEDLINMAKFGVDELIDDLAGTRYASASIDELIDMAKFGVDRQLVDGFAAAGHTDLTPHQLIDIAKFGVDPELAKRFAAIGYRDLGFEQLIDIAKFGLDPALVEGMVAAGFPRPTISAAIDMAKFGVDPELVAELADLGYADLTTKEVIDFAKFGVDGEFLRGMTEAGLTDLSADEILSLARHGVDPERLRKLRDRFQERQ